MKQQITWLGHGSWQMVTPRSGPSPGKVERSGTRPSARSRSMNKPHSCSSERYRARGHPVGVGAILAPPEEAGSRAFPRGSGAILALSGEGRCGATRDGGAILAPSDLGVFLANRYVWSVEMELPSLTSTRKMA